MLLNTIISKADIKKIEDREDWNEKKKLEEKQKLLIICPNCKAQFLPCEVYMPGAFIGHTTDIVKDSLGSLVYADYKTVENLPNFVEKFVCEYCDKPFIVEATPTVFITKEAPLEEDFSTEYVPLY